MYHITPRRNIKSILKHGLIAGKTVGLTPSGPLDVIFLTNDPVYLLKIQAGKSWIKEHDPVILEIETEYYQIEPHKYYMYGPPKNSTFEFVCKEAIIDPDHIKIVDRTLTY